MFMSNKKTYANLQNFLSFELILKKYQYEAAKNAYRRVLEREPNHAKVLQQLGWLYHQQSSSFQSQEQAIEFLEKSVASGRLSSSLFHK